MWQVTYNVPAYLYVKELSAAERMLSATVYDDDLHRALKEAKAEVIRRGQDLYKEYNPEALY